MLPKISRGPNWIDLTFPQPQTRSRNQSQVSPDKVNCCSPHFCALSSTPWLPADLTPTLQTAQSDEMASRPTVTIVGADGAATGATHTIPSVFLSPIRPDIVQQVHTGMAKNKRQPYSVSEKAGHQTSAESWGTG